MKKANKSWMDNIEALCSKLIERIRKKKKLLQGIFNEIKKREKKIADQHRKRERERERVRDRPRKKPDVFHPSLAA